MCVLYYKFILYITRGAPNKAVKKKKNLITLSGAIIYLFIQCSQEVKRRFPDGLPLLDPIEDMGIKDDGLKSVIRVCIWSI